MDPAERKFCIKLKILDDSFVRFGETGSTLPSDGLFDRNSKINAREAAAACGEA